MSEEIDVGDVVFFVRNKRICGPYTVDNLDPVTGKRWLNSLEDDSCVLVEESKLYKDKIKAAMATGRKLCGKYYASKKKLKELQEM